MKSLVQELFARLRDQPAALSSAGPGASEGACHASIALAVEHVVDHVSPRLRAAPGYAKVLREPVAAALRHIDAMAELVPGPLTCSRESFAADSQVNAFFVSPGHLREVFSQSREVRQVFDDEPDTDACWALLCMQMKGKSRPGLALVRNQVQRDVMQTTISFCEHQVVAPGRTERDARQALKCCIFNGFLGFTRHRLEEATQRRDAARILRRRLRQLRTEPGTDHRRVALELELAAAEREIARQDQPIADIAEKLRFVAGILANPSAMMSAIRKPLNLSRLGVQISDSSNEPGYRLVLSEIQIASHAPRVGALVKFPRHELLPAPDFIRQADLFLSQ
jgi:hypothetical protein